VPATLAGGVEQLHKRLSRRAARLFEMNVLVGIDAPLRGWDKVAHRGFDDHGIDVG
jgi:hypothetical protein